MLIRQKPDIPESQVTDRSLYQNRRKFIQSTTALAAMAAVPWGYSDAIPNSGTYSDLKKSKFTASLDSTPKRLATGYVNFYEFASDKKSPVQLANDLQTEPWSVTIEGECHKPGKYTLEDILTPHPFEERIYRFRCVETWAMVVPWVCFPLSDLLKRYEPTSKAKFVEFQTLYNPEQMPNQKRAVLDWPYVEGLRMDEAMHPLAVLAVGMYGEVLPNQNGAPLRLVVPWKYGFKSIKSIVKIRFTETQPKNSWNKATPHEYGFYANVNPNVPHPRWSQAKERLLGEEEKRDTRLFNGYGEQVASLYEEMDLEKYF